MSGSEGGGETAGESVAGDGNDVTAKPVAGSGGAVRETGRPGSRMVVDVAAYLFARILLAVVLAFVIVGAGHLIGVREFPVVVGVLFAIVLALPLGIVLFAPLRRRATASIAVFDERRRRDREQLRARLHGDESPSE